MENHASSFSSPKAYLRALAQTPTRLARRAGSVSTSYDEMSRVRARSGAHMQRTLRWFDLIGLGLGGMVGSGVFVTTGMAAHYAGPAVILSYAIAGFCALLSAFCYTEFAVDMPVAGGAFSYLRVTFGTKIFFVENTRSTCQFSFLFFFFFLAGEFAAFITGANLVTEYVMSNAGVARSLTLYSGSIIGVPTDKWRLTVPGLPDGYNQIDFVAVAVVLIMTVIICYRQQIQHKTFIHFPIFVNLKFSNFVFYYIYYFV